MKLKDLQTNMREKFMCLAKILYYTQPYTPSYIILNLCQFHCDERDWISKAHLFAVIQKYSKFKMFLESGSI